MWTTAARMMNTYAFVCAAVPMLMGVPVLKIFPGYGNLPFSHQPFPGKMDSSQDEADLCQRKRHPGELKIHWNRKNVKLCADGAFTMADDLAANAMVDEVCAEDDFFTMKMWWAYPSAP